MSFVDKILTYISTVAWNKTPESRLRSVISEKRGLVFLMYHSTPEEIWDYGFMTPARKFETQMTFLSRYFDVVSVDKAYNLLCAGKTKNRNKPLAVITFDDGYKNNYEIAYPILKKYQLPFTIFITTNLIEETNETFMSWEEVNSLSDDELVTFGAHSQNHLNLKSLTKEDKKNEIIGSKQSIEKHINKDILYFSYPGGGYDDFSLDIVKNNFWLGFKDRTNSDDKDMRKIARVSIDAKHNEFKAFLIELAKTNYLKGNK